MSYMKRLYESVETASTDSLLHELLFNACPETSYYSPIWGKQVSVFRITLHCADYLVECINDNDQYTIITARKEYT